MKKIFLSFIIALCAFAGYAQPNKSISTYLFNDNWQFLKNADTSINNDLFNPDNNHLPWQKVSLPHTANLEPVIKREQQWQGICFYRKYFVLSKNDEGKHIAVRIDAAMNLADVYLNGKYLFSHKGGYLPLYIDLTDRALYGQKNCLLIRLNNQDNLVIPPGKPLKDLDFNFYSGLYRNAWLIKKNKIYITDAVNAKRMNGGGVLLHYDKISASKTELYIKTDIKNDELFGHKVQLTATLYDPSGKPVGETATSAMVLTANSDTTLSQKIEIANPRFWSPEHPKLYQLVVKILDNNQLLDSVSVKTGVRQISFKADGFYLNGNKYLIRGTNRHQEYPYIGYALSDNAQYRDAYKIKNAGFNFVRCSHYPPSPAFLAACDELGLFVMDSTPGWQFFGDETFQRNSLQNITDMIHRDRNHPAIILWEASLNETDMNHDYMEKANATVHNELPYTDIYTCGWKNDVYDVFIPARQHAKAPDYWKKFNSKPILIAEYGDWEYYAQNAGFNQAQYKDLTDEEKTSRQLRGSGEKRMLQQALNFQEAHNDNLNGTITGDLNWQMFDYKRGYAPDIESSGIMDIFRLPKFAYYFYQSQRSPFENSPTLFIANYWTSNSAKAITIFSNCDEVELFLNGKSLGRQKPDTGRMCNNLIHPPFTFKVAYQPGTIIAKGYIKGKVTATATRKTPGSPYQISLKADYSGKKPASGKSDLIFVYASVTDKNGTVIPNASNTINLVLKGGVQVVGNAVSQPEAGIAAFLVKTNGNNKGTKITATSRGIKSGQLTL